MDDKKNEGGADLVAMLVIVAPIFLFALCLLMAVGA